MKTQGITMIELLIGMVLLAVVTFALLGFTLGTLSYSAKAVTTAERLQELTNITGYLSDNIQRASTILSNVNLDGQSCSLSDTLPCFALIVPEAQTGLAIDTYLLLGYRLEPRNILANAYKVADTWADSNSLVLMEYRKELCGGSSGLVCSGAPAAAGLITNLTAFVVADGLVKPAQMSGKKYFHYDGSRDITLNLRMQDRVRGVLRYIPETLPYELHITSRNIK